MLQQVTGVIAVDPKRWVDFMMRFELGLERPDPKRAPISALTIAISYIVGGLIPLVPYILGLELHRALIYSVLFTGIALALFGAVKGRLTGIEHGQVGLSNDACRRRSCWCGLLFGVAI